MKGFTRRTAVLGGAAVAASPAYAQPLSATLAAHAGYRAWTPPSERALPLNVAIDTGVATKRLADWLEGRPTVLALWATWCGPCLVEKPHQAAMARRLAAARARARILVLQTYDRATLETGRIVLTRLRAAGLINARATPQAETAFISVFGASPRDPRRTSMPSLLLIGADGTELGRAVGTMTGIDGETDYWQDEATFDFLSQL